MFIFFNIPIKSRSTNIHELGKFSSVSIVEHIQAKVFFFYFITLPATLKAMITPNGVAIRTPRTIPIYVTSSYPGM